MDNNEKPQAIARLKEAKNILVTVSDNPSIDQLTAALGFTLLMNKIDKRATTVFSGIVPSVLEFLKPQETIKENTDSLRDFIIALDKSKADKLKYKVEDDVVKIFITPYKTSLSEQDFSFSQGDFNVDVVVALGVDAREHLDKAVMSHGRILHDATIIGIANNSDPMDIGSINWQDPNASSLCEMLAGISDDFKKNLLDGQIATAYLTGIVAETERFSNEKTTPAVMALSSTLMAAGANQQLISNELSTPEISEDVLDELPAPITNQPEDTVSEDGTLTVSHVPEDTIHIDNVGNLKTAEDINRVVNEVQDMAEKPQEQLPPSKDNLFMAPNKDSAQQEPIAPNLVQESEQSDTQNSQAMPGPERFSKYVGYKRPENPINSNIVAPDEEALPDPMSEIPTSNPIDQIVPQTAQNKSTESPLLSTQHDAESVPAIVVPSTPDESQRLPEDGETPLDQPRPLGPQVANNETLEEIENRVMSFEETESANIPAPVIADEVATEKTTEDAEAARQAVLDAMNEAGNFNEDRPEPLESIGAIEFPAPNQQVSNEDIEAPSGVPPGAPPPFVPPFPTYDPEQDTTQ